MGHLEHFSTDSSNLDDFNTVYVNSLNAFDDSVTSIITFRTRKEHILTRPLGGATNRFKVPDSGIVAITTTNQTINNFETDLTGLTSFIFGNIARLDMIQLNMLSNNGGKCFDISNNGPPGFVFLNQASVQGFNSIGTIEGCSFSTENVGWVLNGEGLTLNDMLFIVFREASFAAQTGDHITLTGTLIGAIFDSIIAAPSTGDALFNIDSGLTITQKILIHNNLFDDSNGGTLFAAGSLDQTDPKIIAFNNGNALDSYWVGSFGFDNNATVTTISVVDTPVDVAGTLTTNSVSERYSLVGNEITYNGLESIKNVVTIDSSITRETGNSERNIRTSLLIDSGGGFVEVGSSPMTIRGDIRPNSFDTLVQLDTGHKMKVQVENNTNANNILFKKLNITPKKA